MRILCIGDSNTWGYTPETGIRMEKRWTKLLEEYRPDDKIIEDELKSLLNTSDNASGLLAQRVYDFNSSSGTKVQHFLEFSKDF